MRKGMIPASLKLPPDWIRCVSYSFPKKREPDAQKEQTATQLGLKNFTTSLREIYGPDWKEKADLIAEEIEYFRAKGIPHPALVTVSGQTINNDLTTEENAAGK